jgi:hypothetical protein
MPLGRLDDLSVVEREWLTLSRKIRLTDGFLFIVYFSGDDRITLESKRRLRDVERLKNPDAMDWRVEVAS